MAQDPEFTDGATSQLSQFEKNRFYQGKLMTPRDMEAEQEYHADRLQTLARFVAGSGIVHGLDVGSVVETDDGLEVSVAPGLAVDGSGRPIVVDQETTKTLPRPAEDELHLYLRYDEVPLESVPVPDTQGAAEEERAANRALEAFQLSYQETPTASDVGGAGVADPIADGAAGDPEAVARRLLSSYHDEHRTGVEADDDPGVFLGTFERAPDGTWAPADDGPARALVPDNEFLYAALVQHVADTDDPHRTSAEQRTPDVPTEVGDIDDVRARLEELEGAVDALERDNEHLSRYVRRKAVKDAARRFADLAERLDEKPEVDGTLARDVSVVARNALGEGILESESAFREHVDALRERLLDLDAVLAENTSEADRQRYLEAVEDLDDTLRAGDAAAVDVAEALDHVTEAADSLTVLVTAQPDQ